MDVGWDLEGMGISGWDDFQKQQYNRQTKSVSGVGPCISCLWEGEGKQSEEGCHHTQV